MTLHREKRASAVGERYVENAFSGARSARPQEDLVRDLTKRVDKLEKQVAELMARPAGSGGGVTTSTVEKMIAEALPRVSIAAAPNAEPATVAALQEMATKAVEALRADVTRAAAQSAPAAADVQVLAEAQRTLDTEVAKLRAVLATMKGHDDRLAAIERALGVLHAGFSVVAQAKG